MTTFKSVTDYLASLVWDGTPRLDRWLSTYAGAEDSLYVRKVSREMLVAAVRRARHPGCRLDQLPILEGPQGCGKSSALLVLAVEDAWFTDAFVPDSRGLMEATAGKWILETQLDEWGCDAREFRGCLFRQCDEARRAYEPECKRVQRQFVIIGTTANETVGYLRYAPGTPRFCPVRVQHFDLEKLRADRDQLWAEATEAEALGELHRVLANRTGKLRVSDAYRICGIEPGKVHQDQLFRFGRAIRELGWERQRCRFDGALQYAYVKGTATEREVELSVEYDQHMQAQAAAGSVADSLTEEQTAGIEVLVGKWIVEASELKDMDKGNVLALRAVLKAALSRAMEAPP